MGFRVSKPVERKMGKETIVSLMTDRKRRKNTIYKSKESRSTKYILQINPSILANTVNKQILPTRWIKTKSSHILIVRYTPKP